MAERLVESNDSESDMGHVAVIQILKNVHIEVQNGTFVSSKDSVMQLIQQTPREWFHPTSSHRKEDSSELRKAYVRTILSLISSTNSCFNLSTELAEVTDCKTQQYREHVISTLSIITNLLLKLHPISDDRRTLHTGLDGQGGRGSVGLVHARREDDSNRGLKCHEDEEGERETERCRMKDKNGKHARDLLESTTWDDDSRGHFAQQHGCRDWGEISENQRLKETLRKGEREEDKEEEDSLEGVKKLVKDVVKSTVGPCIALCAGHMQIHPWTDDTCLRTSSELLTKLLIMCGYERMSSLLQGSHHERQPSTTADSQKGMMPKGAFGPVMMELRKQLTRTEWKKHPAAVQAFTWCMKQVKHPYLGEHLSTCLPPSLLLVDDYQVENKIIGIQCLQHLIDNVDPTELRWYGRAEVIYEALQPLLYNHQPHLIDVLYPCLLSLLKVVERDPKKSNQPRRLGRYDNTLQTILTNMEGEQRIVVRQANARHLPAFIEAMGITVLWHMKRLLRVLISYLEASDGPEETGRILTLRILLAVIVQAWPRMSNHCVDLMKSLLRLLVDVSRDTAVISRDGKDTIIKESVQCMVLLKRCCPETVEEIIHKLIASNLQDQFPLDCVKQVLVDT